MRKSKASPQSRQQRKKVSSYDSDPAEPLLNFLRFSCVLTKLQALDPASRNRGKIASKGDTLQGALREGWFTSLFAIRKKGDLAKGALKDTIKERFFGRKSLLASVYDCRNFYGLDSPNNLQQRFLAVLDRMSKGEVLSAEHGRPSVSRYDDWVNKWGEFASRLVSENGGWRNFSACESLGEVEDIWPEKANGAWVWARVDRKADAPDSFVQRILHLASDRYVQILTSTAGPLWGLWFLNSRERLQTLERISDNQSREFYLGRRLPDAKLYIDVIDRTENMRGLPFPFGHAADVLDESGGGSSWTSKAVNAVAKSLTGLKWCPPLLFGGRGDQWEQPDSEAENKVVPYIALGGHAKFGAVYISERWAKLDGKLIKARKNVDFSQMLIVYEPDTWGQVVVEQLEEKYGAVKSKKVTRDRMLSTFEGADADLVLSYYPANSLIDSNTREYFQLSYRDIYQIFGEDGDLLAYDLPSTVLASGTFLSRQPKMPSLIEDLSIYLHKVDATFRHLSPDWRAKQVVRGLQEISANSVKVKKDAARGLSDACDNSARKSNMLRADAMREAVPVRPNQLEHWAREIGKEMAFSILSGRVEGKLEETYEEWAWAMLLPFIRDMSVYISCDLFPALERRKTHEE